VQEASQELLHPHDRYHHLQDKDKEKEQLASADAGTGEVPPECESNAGNVCYVMCLQFRARTL